LFQSPPAINTPFTQITRRNTIRQTAADNVKLTMAGTVIWEAMACTETAEGRATPGITEIGGMLYGN